MFGFGKSESDESPSPQELRQRLADKHPEPISRAEALEIAHAHLDASGRPCDQKAAAVIAQMIDEYTD